MVKHQKVVLMDEEGEQYRAKEGAAERTTITLQSSSRNETIKNIGVFALIYVDEYGKRVVVNIDGTFKDGFLLQGGLLDALQATVNSFDEACGSDDDE